VKAPNHPLDPPSQIQHAKGFKRGQAGALPAAASTHIHLLVSFLMIARPTFHEISRVFTRLRWQVSPFACALKARQGRAASGGVFFAV
jgi:hypothetical protein